MYAFEDLKTFVIRKLQVDPDKAHSSFEPPPKIKREFQHREFRSKISFEVDGEEGIFINENGKSYKGFLYIPIYNQRMAKEKGWNTMPRFHVTKCQTIEDQMNRFNFNGHYVFANIPITDMKDVDGIAKDLIICGYCKSLMDLPSMTTTEYYENYIKDDEAEPNFQEEDLPEEFDVNLWGYTPEWAETSRAYRLKMRFTCESCGLKLDGADGYYLDTHHLNGNKTDNRDNNLKCLCVLCHSNVDSIHQRNFSTGRNRQRLQDFLELFSGRLRSMGNSYL